MKRSALLGNDWILYPQYKILLRNNKLSSFKKFPHWDNPNIFWLPRLLPFFGLLFSTTKFYLNFQFCYKIKEEILQFVSLNDKSLNI